MKEKDPALKKRWEERLNWVRTRLGGKSPIEVWSLLTSEQQFAATISFYAGTSKTAEIGPRVGRSAIMRDVTRWLPSAITNTDARKLYRKIYHDMINKPFEEKLVELAHEIHFDNLNFIINKVDAQLKDVCK